MFRDKATFVSVFWWFFKTIDSSFEHLFPKTFSWIENVSKNDFFLFEFKIDSKMSKPPSSPNPASSIMKCFRFILLIKKLLNAFAPLTPKAFLLIINSSRNEFFRLYWIFFLGNPGILVHYSEDWRHFQGSISN